MSSSIPKDTSSLFYVAFPPCEAQSRGDLFAQLQSNHEHDLVSDEEQIKAPELKGGLKWVWRLSHHVASNRYK